MKKILFLVVSAFAFLSCEDNVQFNNPALQAQKDYSFWKAQDIKVTLNTAGQLTITAISGFETIEMKTASNSIGTYEFGTTNTNNFASYTLDKTQTENNIDHVYTSDGADGPVSKVSGLLSNGLDYVDQSTVETTTSGGGNGLRLKVTTNVNGSVSTVQVVSRGINYSAGDIVYLTGGNNNAAVQVINTQQGNGQIKIEKTENGTYTGTFNFNVVDDEGDVISYNEGIFYKIPVTTVQ